MAFLLTMHLLGSLEAVDLPLDPPIAIQADAAAIGTPLMHHWSTCVGAGRAAEALRASFQEQLKSAVDQCGFRYLRFHGIFHDDMFVLRVKDDKGKDTDIGKGTEIYNFQYVDELFDRMLAIGIKPFVELAFCPAPLAREKGTVFWWKANGAPPTDYAKWGELVARLTRHCVERYGIDEVRTWYFEVWNEPNLRPFFRGTKSEYFQLYQTSAQAVKSVDARLRVGGPATSNFVPDARFIGESENTSEHKSVFQAADLDALEWHPVWVEQFLAWCKTENLPVDFVSCHPYPTDWALDEHTLKGQNFSRGVDATRKDLTLLRDIVAKSPYPRAEIHLTEWSSSPSPRDHSHDRLPAATFVVKANLESIGLANSLSYWTFTDVFEEGGAGDLPFHGGFGMINFQGIPKPTFHAYRFLHQLGDETIATAPGVVVTRDHASKRITALAYHYPQAVKTAVPNTMDLVGQPADGAERADRIVATGNCAPLVIEISGLPAGAPFQIETLDAHHGNAIIAWQAMGRPASPTRNQIETLRQAGQATLTETLTADANGHFTYQKTLSPWSVVQIRQK